MTLYRVTTATAIALGLGLTGGAALAQGKEKPGASLSDAQIEVLGAAVCDDGGSDCKELDRAVKALEKQMCGKPKMCDALDAALAESVDKGELSADLRDVLAGQKLLAGGQKNLGGELKKALDGQAKAKEDGSANADANAEADTGKQDENDKAVAGALDTILGKEKPKGDESQQAEAAPEPAPEADQAQSDQAQSDQAQPDQAQAPAEETAKKDGKGLGNALDGVFDKKDSGEEQATADSGQADANAEADAQAQADANAEADTQAEATATAEEPAQDQAAKDQAKGEKGLADALKGAIEGEQSGEAQANADNGQADTQTQAEATAEEDTTSTDQAAKDQAKGEKGLADALKGAMEGEQSGDAQATADNNGEADTQAEATAQEDTSTEQPKDEQGLAAALKGAESEQDQATAETADTNAEADASAVADAQATADSGGEENALGDQLAAALDKAGKDVSKEERKQMREKQIEKSAKSDALATLLGNSDAQPTDTEEQVVTDENSRSSDEEVKNAEPITTAAESQTQQKSASDSNKNDRNRLLDILGGAAAGFAIGQILDNGDQVVGTTGDRVIVERDGRYIVRKDENELLRRPGSQVQTQTFKDGSTRTVVTRDNGSKVITIRDADGMVLYRSRVNADGSEVVLINEITNGGQDRPVEVTNLPDVSRAPAVEYSQADEQTLEQALRQQRQLNLDHSYTLRQIRENRQLRELMPRVDLDAITFDTGSAAITPDQARSLSKLGNAMADMIDENPDEMFLVEGHTDTVGSEVMNLALSDRRAESVALALTEYFDVPPENMVVQGYGENYLKVERQGDVRANRRATVRRITPLLRAASN